MELSYQLFEMYTQCSLKHHVYWTADFSLDFRHSSDMLDVIQNSMSARRQSAWS